MKKLMVGCMLLALAGIQTATALEIGVFASRWSHKDSDAVWGGGVLILPASLPMEIRGTFYTRSDEGKDRSNTGELQASPLDVGLALGLTRLDTVKLSGVGGASYYWVNAKGYSPDDEFGWYVGGRIEVPVQQNFVAFAEALYRGVKLDHVDFSGFTINLGLLF